MTDGFTVTAAGFDDLVIARLIEVRGQRAFFAEKLDLAPKNLCQQASRPTTAVTMIPWRTMASNSKPLKPKPPSP